MAVLCSVCGKGAMFAGFGAQWVCLSVLEVMVYLYISLNGLQFVLRPDGYVCQLWMEPKVDKHPIVAK